MNEQTILYLRTDLVGQELVAGGSVTHTVGVLSGFLELGYNIVCASSCMETILRTLPLTQLKVLRIPSWLSVVRWKLSCLFSNVFFFFQVLPLVKKYSFSFLYQRYSVLNCTGVLLSTIKKIPLILEYNGSEVWVDQHWSQGRWFKFRRLIALTENINLRHATMIVVVSQALKDDLVSRGVAAEKILVNPNGVDTRLYDPELLAVERAEIRKKCAIEDKFVFGFIGTFSRWHGIEILADMIPEIFKQHSNAHFLLIGDGPLKSFLYHELQALPIGVVTFIATTPPAQARNYLAACDAFLCPTQPNPDGSRFFGSPTKMFEYMSMGKPVIASDLEQLREVISPAIFHIDMNCSENISDSVGVLVEPTSKDFVSAARRVLAMTATQRVNIGSNARKRVAERYTWTHHVHNIVQRFSHAT